MLGKIKITLNQAIIFVIVVLAFCGGIFIANQYGTKAADETVSKTTKLGFEDIGELATQEAYCTQVNSYDESRKIIGLNIPFTNSKCVYSYNVIIKAGIDFSKIEHNMNEEKKIIEIHMPQSKILSCEVDTDSFEVYYEDESIFKPITLEDTNNGLKELQKEAKKTALDNGILEKAKINAETIMKSFFSDDEYKGYKLVFDYEKEEKDKDEK